ncbi:MAG TPA: NAD(P)H-hydrate dehydratase [Planctomycetota bacterium]|nr:NAD(P)H-hydrate dehydratase [Planctomycetota bacterium]
MERLPKLPRRRPDAHKGDCGRVVIVAGSRGMAGAAVLASQAAYRGGAGLVTLVVPENVVDTIAALQVCAIVRAQPVNLDELEADVLAVGPGLGTAPATVAEVRRIVAATKRPLVLDADGLNAFAGEPGLLAASGPPRILTPHPGELARLTDSTPAAINRARRRAAETAAKRFKSIVVLKGRGTVITDGKRTEVNATGNAGMATGGAGDVLTGLIAALVGQGMKPWEAARLGVHLHGLAGDLAAQKLGERSLMATDLLDFLPAAFLAHERIPR